MTRMIPTKEARSAFQIESIFLPNGNSLKDNEKKKKSIATNPLLFKKEFNFIDKKG